MQLFDLTGKTAIITGASGGLGEQCARCLCGAGARVIMTARRFGRLEALASELKNTVALEMDVTDKASVRRAFDYLEKNNERVDICVNNAGIFKETPVFGEEENGDFEAVMQTNVMGVWYVAREAAQYMKRHRIHGSIINIGSVNGADYLQEKRVGYCCSKAAVMQITKAMVGELASAHIRINCIVPGPFHTPATDYKVRTEVLRKELEDRIPLGFFAEPKDIDGTILYLASNAASRYVTGSCVTIDGGVSWGGARK